MEILKSSTQVDFNNSWGIRFLSFPTLPKSFCLFYIVSLSIRFHLKKRFCQKKILKTTFLAKRVRVLKYVYLICQTVINIQCHHLKMHFLKNQWSHLFPSAPRGFVQFGLIHPVWGFFLSVPFLFPGNKIPV